MKRFFLILLLCFCVQFFVSAVSGEESMPWDTSLEKISNALTGKTVMIIGVILIAGAGIMLAASDGGQAKQKIFFIVLGIGIALNAPRLLAMLFDRSEGILW